MQTTNLPPFRSIRRPCPKIIYFALILRARNQDRLADESAALGMTAVFAEQEWRHFMLWPKSERQRVERSVKWIDRHAEHIATIREVARNFRFDSRSRIKPQSASMPGVVARIAG